MLGHSSSREWAGEGRVLFFFQRGINEGPAGILGWSKASAVTIMNSVFPKCTPVLSYLGAGSLLCRKLNWGADEVALGHSQWGPWFCPGGPRVERELREMPFAVPSVVCSHTSLPDRPHSPSFVQPQPGGHEDADKDLGPGCPRHPSLCLILLPCSLRDPWLSVRLSTQRRAQKRLPCPLQCACPRQLYQHKSLRITQVSLLPGMQPGCLSVVCNAPTPLLRTASHQMQTCEGAPSPWWSQRL